ncbi:hypothetical protein PF011_g9150 [Phytophthora fragariae]|uniref:Secreted protein n=1 Tax=Phytophthora fragariae TaxID=53985 RepID=A0A6A3L839_9STRA|nr:hypothetical protein PF011_g9150 [Phytophthora fragariae]
MLKYIALPAGYALLCPPVSAVRVTMDATCLAIRYIPCKVCLTDQHHLPWTCTASCARRQHTRTAHSNSLCVGCALSVFRSLS